MKSRVTRRHASAMFVICLHCWQNINTRLSQRRYAKTLRAMKEGATIVVIRYAQYAGYWHVATVWHQPRATRRRYAR